MSNLVQGQAKVEVKTEQDLHALVEQMTIEEKVAQLQGVWLTRRNMETEQGKFLPDEAEKIMPQGVGHVGRPAENKGVLTPNKDPLATVVFTNEVQTWLKENTRLGIPATFHGETLHGHMAEDATAFPQSIALASSWDADLMEEIFSVVAKEARARGVNHALSPVLDVAKDPRWGRIEETYGEDPYLAAEIGLSVIKGLQGESEPGEGNKLPADKMLTTLKHLAGHGYPMGGQNIAPAMMGERYLREQLLPPFEQAIRHLDVASVMASYNEIDGVPSHANKWLLQQVLRDEWGFKGSVVSDYFAMEELVKRHALVETVDEAGILAINSGVDIELPDPSTTKNLAKSIKDKKIDVDVINQAVFRILRDKYRLGLFDNTYTDPKGVDVIGAEAHKQLSQKAAEESIILLKNNGILPLDLSKVSTVALIGPHVEEVVLGGYSDIPSSSISIADALRDSLPSHVKLIVEPGMRLTENERTKNEKADNAKSYSKDRWNVDKISIVSDEDNAEALARAEKAAKTADLVILMVGDNEGTSREGWNESHLGDRSSLELPGSQPLLLEKVMSAGKPLVTLLQNGRPPELDPWLKDFDALLETWYMGERGGAAVANVLLGKVNPSGKLPLSFPRTAGQIPAYYNHKPTAKRGYSNEEDEVLFPFGFGLSYSEFKYDDLKVKDKTLGLDQSIELSFTVKNTSEIAGKEVLQLYINDPIASITRPVKELKGFYKVQLDAKEKKKIKVSLPVKSLYFWGPSMKRVVEKGEIKLMIGSASNDIRLSTSVKVTGKAEFENAEHLPFFSSWSEK